MLAMLKRLFGSTDSRKASAGPARRRSATGEILSRSREPVPASGASAKRQALGSADGGDFDPYNTGKFDRAASWERVRHSHR